MRVQNFAFLVTLCTPLLADAQGITDYSSHKPGNVTMPKAGGRYTDPVFGTRVIRVTDAGVGSICTHAYSYWPAFNHEDTRLLLACDNLPLLYKFDPATDTVTYDGKLWGADGPHIQFEGATWSYSSPDILWALDQYGTRLWKVNVALRGAAGYTLIHDFKNEIPSTNYVFGLTTDINANVFSFFTRDRNSGKPQQAYVWVRNTNKLYKFPVYPHVFNESKVDKMGIHVMVNYSDNTMALWTPTTGATTWFTYGNLNDDVGGHFDIGQDFIVNSDQTYAGLAGRTFNDLRPPGRVVKYLRPNGAQNWSLCDHSSLRALNEEFVVGSTYLGDGTYGAFEKEIFLGYLDGHGFVRLAHSRSANNIYYYSQPRATVDMKGRYVVWTSDLGQTNRTDVMIVKIPQQYWP